MQTMKQIQQSIITSKELLRTNFDVKTSFTLAQSNINKEVDDILEMQHKEIPVIPDGLSNLLSQLFGYLSFNISTFFCGRGRLPIKLRFPVKTKKT